MFTGSLEATSGSVMRKQDRIAPLGERPQPALLLLLVSRVQQHVHVALVGRHDVEPDRRERRHAALLRDEREPEDVEPEAAVLARHRRREDAALASTVAQPVDDVPCRIEVVDGRDLGLGGQHVLGHVGANLIDDRAQVRPES